MLVLIIIGLNFSVKFTLRIALKTSETKATNNLFVCSLSFKMYLPELKKERLTEIVISVDGTMSSNFVQHWNHLLALGEGAHCKQIKKIGLKRDSGLRQHCRLRKAKEVCHGFSLTKQDDYF